MYHNVFNDSFLEPYNDKYNGMSLSFWDVADTSDIDFLKSIGMSELSALNVFLFFYNTDFIKNVKSMGERENHNSNLDMMNVVSIAESCIHNTFCITGDFSVPRFSKDDHDELQNMKNFLVELSHNVATGSKEYIDIVFTMFSYTVGTFKRMYKMFAGNHIISSIYNTFFGMFKMMIRFPEFSYELQNRVDNQMLYELAHKDLKSKTLAHFYTGMIEFVKSKDSSEEDVSDIVLGLEKDMFINYLRGVLPYYGEYSSVDDFLDYDLLLPFPNIASTKPGLVSSTVQQFIETMESSKMNDILVKTSVAEDFFVDDNGNMTTLKNMLRDTTEWDVGYSESFMALFDKDKQTLVPEIVKEISKNICDEKNENPDNNLAININNVLMMLFNTPLVVRMVSRSVDDPHDIGYLLFKFYLNFFPYTVSIRNSLDKTIMKNPGKQVQIMNMMKDGMDIDTIKTIIGFEK